MESLLVLVDDVVDDEVDDGVVAAVVDFADPSFCPLPSNNSLRSLFMFSLPAYAFVALSMYDWRELRRCLISLLVVMRSALTKRSSPQHKMTRTKEIKMKWKILGIVMDLGYCSREDERDEWKGSGMGVG